MNEYWQRKGIKEALKPQLQIQPQLQTKLDEWKEFYFCQHRKLTPWEKLLNDREKDAELWLKTYEAATIDEATGKRWVRGELVDEQDAANVPDDWTLGHKDDLEKWNSWLK